MELDQANQIINGTRAIMQMDGYSVSRTLQTAGALSLLGVNSIDFAVEKVKLSPYKNTSFLFLRILEVKAMPLPIYFDTALLLFIHKKLFSDFKTDCGLLRKINISKNGASCIDHKLLQSSLNSVMEQLKKYDPPKNVSKADFCAVLVHYMREFFILSPFSYGNGVTIRVFFELYCASNGFELDYNVCPYREFSEAENASLTEDNIQPLYLCLIKSVGPLKFIFNTLRIETQKKEPLRKLGANLGDAKTNRQNSRAKTDRAVSGAERQRQSSSSSPKRPSSPLNGRLTTEELKRRTAQRYAGRLNPDKKSLDGTVYVPPSLITIENDTGVSSDAVKKTAERENPSKKISDRIIPIRTIIRRKPIVKNTENINDEK